MASRDLTATMAAAVQAAVVRPAILYEGEFYAAGSPSAQFLRLWTGMGDLVWNSYTWTGGGNLLSISPIEESTRIEALGFSVTLSGMPSALISLALQSIRQGKPGKLWLALLAPVAYLSLPGVTNNNATTPDSAALDITGDLDIRAKIALNDWTGTATQNIISKRDGNLDRSYRLYVKTNGTLEFVWSTDGTAGGEAAITSSVAVGAADGSVKWVRFTFDADNGAAGRTGTFYTSDDGITWTQLGAVVTTAPATSIFSSTSRLMVGGATASGAEPIGGNVYRAQLYNGIAGTLAVDFDPLKFSGSNTTATMDTGEVWTINQSVVGSPTYLPARIVPQSDEVLADPYLLQDGRFDIVVLEDDGETCTIRAQYESRLVDLLKPRARRFTPEDQAIDYPLDTGFDKVPALQDMVLLWGGPGAASSPVAMPGDTSNNTSNHDDNTGPGGSYVYTGNEAVEDNHNE